MAETETNTAKFYNVVDLSPIASPTELTQWQPDFGVRIFLALLVHLVRVIDPKKAFFLVDDSYAWIVVQILVLLVHNTRQVVKFLEL